MQGHVVMKTGNDVSSLRRQTGVLHVVLHVVYKTYFEYNNNYDFRSHVNDTKPALENAEFQGIRHETVIVIETGSSLS